MIAFAAIEAFALFFGSCNQFVSQIELDVIETTEENSEDDKTSPRSIVLNPDGTQDARPDGPTPGKC